MKKILEELAGRIECGPCLSATNKARHTKFCPLHAAAPELLNALKELVNSPNAANAAWDRARVAIAKATQTAP